MFFNYRTLKKFSSNCFIFEFNPNKIRFDATIGKSGKLEKLSNIMGEPTSTEIPIAKMNGGFFMMNGKSEYLGTFVDEGKLYNGPRAMYPTIIFWKTKKLLAEFETTAARHSMYQKDAYWAIGCPWTLIVNGAKEYHYTKQELINAFGHPFVRAPRTLVGQKPDSTIIWVVVDGRKKSSLGITLPQSQELMLELGCNNAFNFDGGGSSEFILYDLIKNKPSDGAERSIGTAFMAYLNIGADGIYGKVNATNLNVRKGNTTSSTSIGKLKSGDYVHIIGYQKTWYLIDYNGTHGYVYAPYIELSDYTPINNSITNSTDSTIINSTNSIDIKPSNDKSISLDSLSELGYKKIIL